MTHCRAAPASEPSSEEGQGHDYGHLGNNRRGQRTADCEHTSTDSRNHNYPFLSWRTRSISSFSASRSSSVQDASVTRAVIISRSDPPKKVCKYCWSAVRFATAGEIVAE